MPDTPKAQLDRDFSDLYRAHLRDVLDGRSSPDAWLERVRSGAPAKAGRRAA